MALCSAHAIVSSIVFDRIEYPTLFGMFLTGMGLLVLSAALDLVGINETAGFLALFSVVAFLLAGTGYLSIFLLKYGSRTAQRRRAKTH